MPKGQVSNFTTTSSLPGASMESNEGGETPATRFGNFEVLTNADGGLHLLGGGGFGKTYKARHVYLNQIVALKVINDRFLNDTSAKERFLREAQVVHQLRHPNIAHVLDFGEVKHSLYYAMEFCGGGNLENLIGRTGPLALPLAMRCARQLAEALGCAHSHGFIHRDVKPANVMLTGEDDADPQLKLVDFGLVKHLQGGGSEATAALTMTGQQFFTIQFASPEQLMEEELDARSDIFALGMTIWFLLKGSAPEVGSMASIVAKRLDAKSYEPNLPVELPPAYRAFLARLLEKDRNLRFQNTDEVLATLAAAERAPDVAPGSAAVVSPAAGPSPEDAAARTLAEPPPEPVAAGPGSITGAYTILENIGAMPLGVLYRATSNADEQQVAITMIGDALREDASQRSVIEQNVRLLKAQPHETIARVYGLEEYQEGLALVQEWHRGISLHNILKSARFIHYADALRVLLPIAQGTDWTTERGLPGVVLAMDEIYLQPIDEETFSDVDALLATPLKSWPPFRVRLLPYVIREDASQDVGMTLNTEIVSDPSVAFGCLLYHLVAGHTPRAAAKLSKSAYVTIGRFAEDSNRLLASCIANEQDFGGCVGVLRALNANEGVNFPSDTARPATAELRGGRVQGAPAGEPAVAPSKPRTLTGGLPISSGPSPATTGTRPGSPVTGGGGVSGRTELRSNKSPVETRRIPPTGGGLPVARPARDVAREAEEARAKQEQEEAQARLRQEAAEQARREAEEAEVRRQAGEEARARKEAEDLALREQQAEDARVRKLAAEERARKEAEDKRLKKQQADEEKSRRETEARRLKQQQDEEKARRDAEARLLRQQQDEERARRDAEAKELKRQQAEEARARKQQADEEKLRLAAEEKLLKQRQADALRQQQAEAQRAKKLELHTLKPSVDPTSPGALPIPANGDQPIRPAGLSPVVLVALAVGGLVLAGVGAYFAFHKTTVIKTPDVVDRPVVTDPPVVVTQQPTPVTTPASTLPDHFVFAKGIQPKQATVKLNGTPVVLSYEGEKGMVPLAGAPAGSTVTVEYRGYQTQTFPVNQKSTVDEPVRLRRERGEVDLRLTGGSSDYATVLFRPLQALPGEQSYVHMDPESTNVALGPNVQASLPTGIYEVKLLGPASDVQIQPRVLSVRCAVTPQRTTLAIPPSFAGRYSFDFLFKQDVSAPAMHVHRTIVLDPGLQSGHMDDDYQGNGGPLGTQITDLTLNEFGVLHGLIRLSLRRDKDKAYDEQFELQYEDGKYVIVGGGWDSPPTDPETAAALKAQLKDYQLHLARPKPENVTKE